MCPPVRHSRSLFQRESVQLASCRPELRFVITVFQSPEWTPRRTSLRFSAGAEQTQMMCWAQAAPLRISGRNSTGQLVHIPSCESLRTRGHMADHRNSSDDSDKRSSQEQSSGFRRPPRRHRANEVSSHNLTEGFNLQLASGSSHDLRDVSLSNFAQKIRVADLACKFTYIIWKPRAVWKTSRQSTRLTSDSLPALHRASHRRGVLRSNLRTPRGCNGPDSVKGIEPGSTESEATGSTIFPIFICPSSPCIASTRPPIRPVSPGMN